MEGAGLNYKKLVTAMSVMTLAAVYTAACIALPRLVKNPGQGIRTRKDVYSNADAESEDTGIKIDFTKKTVVIDAFHVVFASRAFHGLQNSRMSVLERNVEVRQDLAFSHQRNDFINGGIRVHVMRTYPNAEFSELFE